LLDLVDEAYSGCSTLARYYNCLLHALTAVITVNMYHYTILLYRYGQQLSASAHTAVVPQDPLSDPQRCYAVALAGTATRLQITSLGLVLRSVTSSHVFSYLWEADSSSTTTVSTANATAGTATAAAATAAAAAAAGASSPREAHTPPSTATTTKRPLSAHNSSGTGGLAVAKQYGCEEEFAHVLRMRSSDAKRARDRALALARRLWSGQRLATTSSATSSSSGFAAVAAAATAAGTSESHDDLYDSGSSGKADELAPLRTLRVAEGLSRWLLAGLLPHLVKMPKGRLHAHCYTSTLFHFER
jgi:hypothetical protein